jgi:hypothetical protein
MVIIFPSALPSSQVFRIIALLALGGKEFLNASRWYFGGPPPAFGGRRPRAKAAARPQGWPPLKTSLFTTFQRRVSEWEEEHWGAASLQRGLAAPQKETLYQEMVSSFKRFLIANGI